MKSFSRRGAIRRRITSAHLIALVALFVALGGISWAAATAPKNSVAAKSLKKNAVTSAKIKNNAVTGRKIKANSILASDIKNDVLTGLDINESTLGAVPEAAKLSSDVANVVNTPSSAANADPNVARTQAAEVPLASYGSISIYAKCFKDLTSESVLFEVFAKTSADGGVTAGDVDSSALDSPALNVGTAETDRSLQTDETDTATNDLDEDYSDGTLVLGPDGKGLDFVIIMFGRVGNPPDPARMLPGADSCQFRLTGQKVG